MTMTKVKVCGITRCADAISAAELGASAVGFVFWERSPRFVEPSTARAIATTLPPDVATVGVFVNPSRARVREVVETVGLTAVQLHGDETAAFCVALPYRVMKAVALRTPQSVEQALAFPESVTVLLDVHDPVTRGGTGQTVDWDLAAAVATRRRVFLAGGLGPSNVAEAITAVRPYAVDASSRLETAPGVKSVERMREFFDALAAVDGRPAATTEEGRPWSKQHQG